VLHQGPGVSITTHTEPGHEGDRLGRNLAESMIAIDADGEDTRLGHAVIIPRCPDAARTPR
jgi:hypothetical protein